jgi:hypothetical protein
MNTTAVAAIPMAEEKLAKIQAWRKKLYDGEGIPHDPNHWLTQLCYDLRENGVFVDGVESDRKQRGAAINIKVTDRDDAQQIAILQVREAIFHPSRYTKVHKDYYLIGRVETGAPFAHPLTELVTARHTVKQALAKLWRCDTHDLDDIERQGDIAFVPVRKAPKTLQPVEDREIIIRKSHRIRGDIYQDPDTGEYYIRGQAWMVHLKGEHPTVTHKGGLRRIQPAVLGRVWGHSAPTPD